MANFAAAASQISTMEERRAWIKRLSGLIEKATRDEAFVRASLSKSDRTNYGQQVNLGHALCLAAESRECAEKAVAYLSGDGDVCLLDLEGLDLYLPDQSDPILEVLEARAEQLR